MVTFPWSDFPAGDSRASCPSCGRSPRDRTLGVTIDRDGRGVAHCFRCNYVETTRGERRMAPPKPQNVVRARQRYETLSAYGRDLWRACSAIDGVAAAYLEARACVLPPADGGLRWHPRLRHPSGHEGPALVALVTDALTGEPRTLHRTWIRSDGRKADVDPPRMLLGGHRKQGAVIRLWPNEDVVSGLGVAEGIETALSLAQAHRPCWSVIDAGNLAVFPVLLGIEALLIAADFDPAGIAAAETCATRWTKAGAEVRIVMAHEPKSDICDVGMAA